MQVHIRKVKLLKQPKFDLGTLLNLHGESNTDEQGQKVSSDCHMVAVRQDETPSGALIKIRTDSFLLLSGRARVQGAGAGVRMRGSGSVRGSKRNDVVARRFGKD